VTRRDGKQSDRKLISEEPRRPKRGDAIPDGADLEAKIKGQLQSIAAALSGLSGRPSAAAPPSAASPPAIAESPFAPPVARPPQPLTPNRPRRSEFAPDPVRQRTYFDLRSPPEQRPEAGAPGGAASVANVPATARAGPGERWPQLSRPEWDSEPVAGAPPVPVRRRRPAQEDQARSRGLDARTLSIASLVGIGMGLAGLAVMNQFGSPSVPSIIATSSIETKQPVDGKLSRNRIVTAAQRNPAGPAVIANAPVKEQERLVTDNLPVLRDGLQPEGKTAAMVAESIPVGEPPGTAPAGPAPESLAGGTPDRPATAESAAGAPTERPVIAEAAPNRRSPAPQPRQDAAAAASDPTVLAYAPVPPTRDPTAHSFHKEAASDTGPAQNTGPGTARTNADVNMHSAADNAASVVAVVPTGTLVRIARCDFWCEVTVDGKRGFIYRKFVGR
jgi:Bacterial SH3 domain